MRRAIMVHVQNQNAKGRDMAKAIYDIPFPDFDYKAMAEACGCTFVSQTESKLEVEGSHMAIASLSADLDFGPVSVDPAE
jgi:hypothetical protein